METISDSTEQDKKRSSIFDYMPTYSNAVVRFHASDIILCADTDASYMTGTEACCPAAWFFFWTTPLKMCAGAPK